MAIILILLMSMGVILFLFYSLCNMREYLLKYLSSVGGKKPRVIKISPVVFIPLLVIHFLFGCAIGWFTYFNETDGSFLIRLLISIVMALFGLLLLFSIYFMIGIMVKEIIAMKDLTINIILLYSIFSFSILFYQVFTDTIEFFKEFLWISILLYVTNLISIGKIIWIIFHKKISVKSIWSIALLNITCTILSLTNVAYVIQKIYNGDCYSRILTSWGDAFYFVVISFFTVGYGDLYPVCEVTKIISMVIIMTGFTFTAVFVSAALSATIEHFGSMS